MRIIPISLHAGDSPKYIFLSWYITYVYVDEGSEYDRPGRPGPSCPAAGRRTEDSQGKVRRGPRRDRPRRGRKGKWMYGYIYR